MKEEVKVRILVDVTSVLSLNTVFPGRRTVSVEVAEEKTSLRSGQYLPEHSGGKHPKPADLGG